MKRKLLVISAIVASISLTACGSDGTQNNIDSEPLTETEESKGVVKDAIDTAKDTIKDAKDVVEDINEKTDNVNMTDEEMIEASDYIAKVKRIQKGKDVFELKVLENIKGNLTGKDISKADSLNENRTYVVFLRDVDGVLEATDGTDSYILLEGDNHKIFEKINKHTNR